MNINMSTQRFLVHVHHRVLPQSYDVHDVTKETLWIESGSKEQFLQQACFTPPSPATLKTTMRVHVCRKSTSLQGGADTQPRLHQRSWGEVNTSSSGSDVAGLRDSISLNTEALKCFLTSWTALICLTVKKDSVRTRRTCVTCTDWNLSFKSCYHEKLLLFHVNIEVFSQRGVDVTGGLSDRWGELLLFISRLNGDTCTYRPVYGGVLISAL